MKKGVDEEVKCTYEYDPESSTNLKDCDSCIHEKRRTCPYGMYMTNGKLCGSFIFPTGQHQFK